MAIDAPALESVTMGATTATLVWTAVSGATSYVVKYGTVSGVYTTEVDVGLVLTYQITGLSGNSVYYFAVQTIQETQTILDVDFDGADASTDFVDRSVFAHTIRHTGEAGLGGCVIDTAQSVAGGSSGLFAGGPGNNLTHLRITDHAIFNLSNVGWAITLYYRAASFNTNTKALFSQWVDSGTRAFYLYHTLAGADQVVRFNYGVGGAETEFNSGTAIVVNTWYKIKVERVDNTLNFYISTSPFPDTLVATQAISDTIDNPAYSLNIGCYADGSSASQTPNGWIDELLFEKEVNDESGDSNELSGSLLSAVDGTGFTPYRRCGFIRTATISTLDVSHLEGQKVGVVANGRFLGYQRVISGAIVLNDYYSHIIVGLPYVSDLETLPIEVQTKEGTLIGRKTLFTNVTFRLVKSLGGKIGPNKTTLYEAFTEENLRIANQSTELDDPIGDSTVPKLYTCDIKSPLGAEYKGNARVFVRQTLPYPITLAAIVPDATITQQSG